MADSANTAHTAAAPAGGLQHPAVTVAAARAHTGQPDPLAGGKRLQPEAHNRCPAPPPPPQGAAVTHVRMLYPRCRSLVPVALTAGRAADWLI